MVYRVYTERRESFRQENEALRIRLQESLGIELTTKLRIVRRYDVEGIDEDAFRQSISQVFADPVKDTFAFDLNEYRISDVAEVIAVEALPGQFDQRADSAAQCIQFVIGGERPTVRSANFYIFEDKLAEDSKNKIINELVNPVENRLASFELPETLQEHTVEQEKIEILQGFREMAEGEDFWLDKLSLAMDAADLRFCKEYFLQENRDPSITEIRLIDTYWSDHCRHTTFNTAFDEITIHDDLIQKSFDRYIAGRESLQRQKPITLMDLATIAAKELKKDGILLNVDESEEINACTVKIDVKVQGKEETEAWLLLFKNETHNHPTEIEPFGGAATCLGGAIRDPLSGRAYVYQAMRITGAADPYTSEADTPEGKLQQRQILKCAAQGYSSYGNQIGVPTGFVEERYHPGYLAKRMECGAVIGAVPEANVIRKTPASGDIVLLIGGRTGRDGLGGATGSSKSHTIESVENSAAEVQKGNAPEERAIMRLFRNAEISRKIKRCNDFGAGGVSVAIGELADGLEINLDAVPKKYEGLDGTEIAISESQERMAVVIAPEDLDFFMEMSQKENIECTKVAEVTDQARVRMHWAGDMIVDLSREFLDSNGAPKTTKAEVTSSEPAQFPIQWNGSLQDSLVAILKEYNVASQRGLIEQFDQTVGARSVFLPLGGKTQSTPTQVMAARIPRIGNTSRTASLMSYGYNPLISASDEYAGAYLAVVESVARLVAAGGRKENMWLSFQEFFRRLGDDPTLWGSPLASLLGAYQAQMDLGLAAIGGKDSMSGTFEDLHVPPTLISFAVSVNDEEKLVSPEAKRPNAPVFFIETMEEIDEARSSRHLMNAEQLQSILKYIAKCIEEEKVASCSTAHYAGAAEAMAKMLFGNQLGLQIHSDFPIEKLFAWNYASFIVEWKEDVSEDEIRRLQEEAHLQGLRLHYLGDLTESPYIHYQGESIALDALQTEWEAPLEEIYPTRANQKATEIRKNWTTLSDASKKDYKSRIILPTGVEKPRVVIPVFPGTNCEEETAAAFERAGANADVVIVRNRTAVDIETSVEDMYNKIQQAQILFIPGGFSGGDEPDGSGKFINAFFRNAKLFDAIHELLDARDGLVGGICNGFQALVKLGLLPFGRISEMDERCPVLDSNLIGRHQTKIVQSKILSNKSPWLMYHSPGEIQNVAISHGEGKFVCEESILNNLFKNGQVVSQYVDTNGVASMDIRYNPNASMAAIEGLISEDGKVFGRMGHSERMVDGTLRNMGLDMGKHEFFRGACDYFKS